MPIRVECVNCGGAFRVPDDTAGKKSRCPKCNEPLRIPIPLEEEVVEQTVAVVRAARRRTAAQKAAEHGSVSMAPRYKAGRAVLKRNARKLAVSAIALFITLVAGVFLVIFLPRALTGRDVDVPAIERLDRPPDSPYRDIRDFTYDLPENAELLCDFSLDSQVNTAPDAVSVYNEEYRRRIGVTEKEHRTGILHISSTFENVASYMKNNKDVTDYMGAYLGESSVDLAIDLKGAPRKGGFTENTPDNRSALKGLPLFPHLPPSHLRIGESIDAERLFPDPLRYFEGLRKLIGDYPREKHAWIHREDDIVDGGKRFARLLVHQYCYWEGFLEHNGKRLRFKLAIAVNGEYNYDIARKFVTRVALEGRMGLNGRYGIGKLWEKAAWSGFFTCEYKFRTSGEK